MNQTELKHAKEKEAELLAHPDIVLSDVACLSHPPRLHRDFHRFGGQQVPRRLPAEEFLTKWTKGGTGLVRSSH